MVTSVNILLVQMKKHSSECTPIISLLKKIFWKHIDKVDGFFKLSPL